jgi:hypothetical protein
MLVTGLTILALVYFQNDLRAMGDQVDFELILPFALKNYVPVGLLGLLIAGLLAAFMSTFAATVNAAPAYLVNDVYKKYIKPDAPAKTYVNLSYLVSVAVVLIGTVIGLFVSNLNDLVQWIVAALYGGYTASNLLKWHWWRFNGYGFFWGMASGIVASMIIPELMPDLTPLYAFPVILVISVLGSVLGSLLTPADDQEVLENFYLKVRPWGAWGPVLRSLQVKYPDLEPNKELGKDSINVAIGMVWQTALTAAPIFLVAQYFTYFWIAMAVIAVTTLLLKFTWYDKLRDWAVMPAGLEQSDEQPVENKTL